MCKVLARSGFLSDVLVENTQNMIVKARNEKSSMERTVRQLLRCNYFMVEYGAFYVGMNYYYERNQTVMHALLTICVLETQGLEPIKELES